MNPKSKPQVKKVVLAYSGGLDTSVIVRDTSVAATIARSAMLGCIGVSVIVRLSLKSPAEIRRGKHQCACCLNLPWQCASRSFVPTPRRCWMR